MPPGDRSDVSPGDRSPGNGLTEWNPALSASKGSTLGGQTIDTEGLRHPEPSTGSPGFPEAPMTEQVQQPTVFEDKPEDMDVVGFLVEEPSTNADLLTADSKDKELHITGSIPEPEIVSGQKVHQVTTEGEATAPQVTSAPEGQVLLNQSGTGQVAPDIPGEHMEVGEDMHDNEVARAVVLVTQTLEEEITGVLEVGSRDKNPEELTVTAMQPEKMDVTEEQSADQSEEELHEHELKKTVEETSEEPEVRTFETTGDSEESSGARLVEHKEPSHDKELSEEEAEPSGELSPEEEEPTREYTVLAKGSHEHETHRVSVEETQTVAGGEPLEDTETDIKAPPHGGVPEGTGELQQGTKEEETPQPKVVERPPEPTNQTITHVVQPARVPKPETVLKVEPEMIPEAPVETSPDDVTGVHPGTAEPIDAKEAMPVSPEDLLQATGAVEDAVISEDTAQVTSEVVSPEKDRAQGEEGLQVTVVEVPREHGSSPGETEEAITSATDIRLSEVSTKYVVEYNNGNFPDPTEMYDGNMNFLGNNGLLLEEQENTVSSDGPSVARTVRVLANTCVVLRLGTRSTKSSCAHLGPSGTRWWS